MQRSPIRKKPVSPFISTAIDRFDIKRCNTKGGKSRLEQVLIITTGDKSAASLTAFLNAAGVRGRFVTVQSGADARRQLTAAVFDLILVNTPLSDEFGSDLAQFAAHETTAGVILMTKSEISDAVAEKVETDGVFVLAKPVGRALFFQALHLIRAARSRIRDIARENDALRHRIEDIRLIDRAKCILIECCSMTEPEAHAYIEREAMNKRLPKREVAREILSGSQPGT